MKNKIPKIIHYCWFGNNKKSELVNKCIKSWKKYLRDYEIKEWNDSHLGLIDLPYVKEAYEAKKYAFVTDYFRLYALYNYGGIYLDSDNEVLKSFDEFLNLEFFSGYENYYGNVAPFTAVVGAQKYNKIIKDLLDEYNDLHFIKENGEYDLYTNTARVTDYFQRAYNFVPPYNEKFKKQLEDRCIIYPSNYFCNYEKSVSYAVHHFNGSWCEKEKLKLIENIFSIKNKYIGKMKIKYLTIFGKKIILREKYIYE